MGSLLPQCGFPRRSFPCPSPLTFPGPCLPHPALPTPLAFTHAACNTLPALACLCAQTAASAATDGDVAGDVLTQLQAALDDIDKLGMEGAQKVRRTAGAGVGAVGQLQSCEP